MSSSPATGPSAELIRYAHGSNRIVRTCRPCVTPVLLTTRGSAHRPRSIGCPACMNGNYSSSPEEESATGRPDRDPLATQDDPAKFLTQDTPGTSANRSWALRAGPTGHLRKHPQARLWPRRGSATRAARPGEPGHARRPRPAHRHVPRLRPRHHAGHGAEPRLSLAVGADAREHRIVAVPVAGGSGVVAVLASTRAACAGPGSGARRVG